MLPTVRRSVRNIWEDPFELMQHEVQRMLGRGARGGNGGEAGELVGVYPVDIREDHDSIYVDAELPGFKREEIQVTLEDGMLSISAERKEDEAADPKRGTRHLTERRFTRVERSFSLPSSVDSAQVEATLKDGVLHLKLQKREEVKPRKIEVK